MIIRPFNGMYFCLMAAIAAAVYISAGVLRGKGERAAGRWIILLSACNIVLYFTYKWMLSKDAQFLAVSGYERFNWFNELPIQLCNINLFLIPIGVLTRKRPILGFAFFVAPLGAFMALTFPETAFSGYSMLIPRIAGFYLTHALLIVCGLSLCTLGLYRPDERDIPDIIKTLTLLLVCAHCVNMVLRATVCPEASYFFTYGGDIGLLRLMMRFIPYPLLYQLPAIPVAAAYMGALTRLFRPKRAEQPEAEEEPERSYRAS